MELIHVTAEVAVVCFAGEPTTARRMIDITDARTDH